MKKTLALVLSFLLCFGLSMNTFAEEGVNDIEDLQYVEDNISEPIQSYSADYNGGTCTLNIYDNDMCFRL